MLTVIPKPLENQDSEVNRNATGHDKQALSTDWPEWDHPVSHPCMSVLASVSGMSRARRERARLVVLQAWFDDSGKSKNGSPVYLLAGYSSPVSDWAPFADAWKGELNREPKLGYLHTYDAYSFENEFGRDVKTGEESAWLRYWGPKNTKARDERLLPFAQMVAKYKPRRFRFLLTHRDYDELSGALSKHPLATKPEIRAIKNPYYVAFSLVLGKMLKGQEGSDESIHILFDEDIDRRSRLKDGFAKFVNTVTRNAPHLLELLVNKEAEFRNDKKHEPLQAADLLAWHTHRACLEASRGHKFMNEVWEILNAPKNRDDYIYRADEWKKIIDDIGDYTGMRWNK